MSRVFRTIVSKTRTGIGLGDQDSRLGPSWVLVLLIALEITVVQSSHTLLMFLNGEDDRSETWVKTACFHLEIAHAVAPRRGTRLIPHSFAFLLWPNRYGRTTALIGNTYTADQRSS